MSGTTPHGVRPTAIILPTYQESQTIEAVVTNVLEEHRDLPVEIVVVDDDSPDGTAELVQGLSYDDVHCIRRTAESGLSSAVLRGMDETDADWYAVMDADGQHPSTAPRSLLYRLADGADMAVGSRHLEAGGVAGDWPLHRQVISWGAQACAWAAVPQARDITDPMTGLFAVDSAVVDAVREQLRPHGYKIGLELLARCPIERVDEVPYTFSERVAGESNLGPAEYVQYVRHLARLTVPSRRSTSADVTVAPGVSDS